MPKHLSKGFRNVLLVGMPATGKSLLGKNYAHHTGRTFVDFDRFLERTVGKSISELFATEGEAEFRKLETKVLQKLSRRSHSVIAFGGGTFSNVENAQIISEMGWVVCLNSPIDILASRIFPVKEQRPLFQDCQTVDEVAGRVGELLEARAQFYDPLEVQLNTAFSSIDNLKLELSLREKKAWDAERRNRPREQFQPASKHQTAGPGESPLAPQGGGIRPKAAIANPALPVEENSPQTGSRIKPAVRSSS